MAGGPGIVRGRALFACWHTTGRRPTVVPRLIDRNAPSAALPELPATPYRLRGDLPRERQSAVRQPPEEMGREADRGHERIELDVFVRSMGVAAGGPHATEQRRRA